MLAHAFAAGVPCQWVTGDRVYGVDNQPPTEFHGSALQ
jgi:hypothetical protein